MAKPVHWLPKRPAHQTGGGIVGILPTSNGVFFRETHRLGANLTDFCNNRLLRSQNIVHNLRTWLAINAQRKEEFLGIYV